MSLVKEFKEFALRGNLIDTAIAFVIGASFGKIVTSFVEGMVMPLVGMLTGGVDFNEKKWILKQAITEVKDTTGKIIISPVAEVSVKYGTFLTNVLDFIIVAFIIFLIIQAMNKAKKKEAEAILEVPTPPSTTEVLLSEIRDALKK